MDAKRPRRKARCVAGGWHRRPEEQPKEAAKQMSTGSRLVNVSFTVGINQGDFTVFTNRTADELYNEIRETIMRGKGQPAMPVGVAPTSWVTLLATSEDPHARRFAVPQDVLELVGAGLEDVTEADDDWPHFWCEAAGLMLTVRPKGEGPARFTLTESIESAPSRLLDTGSLKLVLAELLRHACDNIKATPRE